MDDSNNDFVDGFAAGGPAASGGRKCSQCDGEGVYALPGEPMAKCPQCGGAGVLPTEAVTLLAQVCGQRDAYRQRVAQLEAALRPFAEFAEAMDTSGHTPHVDDYCPLTRWLMRPMMKDARDARDVLSTATPEPKAA